MKKTKTKDEETGMEPKFTSAAFTVFRDPATQHWIVGKVKLDPELKVSSDEVEILVVEENKEIAQERFRIIVGTELF